MSQYKYGEIAETMYFWFAANTTAGAADDGATPLYDVRLAGAAASAIPIASGTPTLLTHANYTDGLHEIAIDTTGYAAGEYAVFCTLTISTVNPAGFCGSFLLRTAGTAALDVNTVSQDNIDFGATQKASINTEVDTALSDINLDHLMKTAVASNADMTTEVTDGTVLSNIMTKGSDTSDFVVATDSLEALKDFLNALNNATQGLTIGQFLALKD